MSAKPTYTLCFDWVVRVTGSSTLALTYGVIYRYAQMKHAKCYASCERLAGDLGWSRQRIGRHIKQLLQWGLICRVDASEPGITREYVPVSEEEWRATRRAEGACSDASEHVQVVDDGVDAGASASPEPSKRREPIAPDEQLPSQGEERVTYCDTPCNKTLHPPVTNRNTRNTTNDTKKRPGRRHASRHAPKRSSKGTSGSAPRRASGRPPAAPPPHASQSVARSPSDSQRETRGAEPPPRRGPDPRTRLPAIQLFRTITGMYPPKARYDDVLAAIGPHPSEDRLRACYREWCARGYNPHGFGWLLDWYAGGNTTGSQVPGGRFQARASGPARPRNLAPGTCNHPLNAGPPASPDDFARWNAYQQAIRNGEDPNEAKRRLGL